MCGICGIVLPDGSPRTLTQQLLQRMRDTMVHRGPDGEGAWLDHGVALGHRRLSIIDVAGGAQPMTSADGRFVITYNGEVYNHPLLKRELEASGANYRTRCDTETVLHCYAIHGHDAPQHLRGMFAAAIWDRQRRELFLMRDRLGVKPLYYVHAPDGALYFASEIKALIAAGAVTPALDQAVLPEYLANRAVFGDRTMFEGVRRLPPGHTLTWHEGRVTVSQYWDVSFHEPADEGRTDRSWVDEFEQRFQDAVTMRLMSDVPLGMFLSGGIDSAAITAAMSQASDGPIRTFSVAFQEREGNELAYARLVAERFRTEHHEIVLGTNEFFSLLPRLIWHEDEPLAHPSSVPLFAVSRLAAEHVKVVLTGEGSDESLAGYPWYRTTCLQKGWGERYHAHAPALLRQLVRRAVGSGGAARSLRSKLRRTFLYLPPDLDTLLYDNFGVFGRARQASLLSPGLAATLSGINPYASVHAAAATGAAPSLLGSLLYTDIKTYLHELLMKQDQMSMAASIESRVPFLDHPFVEFMARMPDRMKLRGLTTKYILRRAMKDRLPAQILSRRKMGFPVPLRRWFAGSHADLLEQYVLHPRALARGLFDPAELRRLVAAHRAGQADHADRLWMLLNLELWHRIFVDGEEMAALPATRGAAA